MIDATNLIISEPGYAKRLLAVPNFPFGTTIDDRTGEYLTGEYQATSAEDFRTIVYPSGLVQVRGSLHYLANGGRHNADDLTFTRLRDTINFFADTWHIDPTQVKVGYHEVGLNFITDQPAKVFLESIVTHKKIPVLQMQIRRKSPGFGIEVERGEYRIKAYDKGRQFGVSDHLVRFEVATNRTRRAREFKSPLLLKDLARRDVLARLAVQVKAEFDDLLIVPELPPSKLTKPERKVYEFVTNPRNWRKITPSLAYQKRHRIRGILTKYGVNTHLSAAAAVAEKIAYLLDN